MSKTSRAAQAAIEDAELKAMIEREDARRTALRAETTALLRDREQAAALARLEAEAEQIEQATVSEPDSQLSTSGFWADRLHRPEPVPASPAADDGLDPADISGMSFDQYASWRQQAGMDGRGIENTGRTGQHLATESGFPSWSDRSANRMVFRGELGERYR